MRWLRVLCWLCCWLAPLCCAAVNARGAGGGSAQRTSDELEVVPRGELVPDAEQVRRLPEVDQALAFPRAAGDYHALAAADCQCLAVQASKLGNLYDGERRAMAASESASCCCRKTDTSLTYDVLRTAALEARNRSAGDALEAYYLLEQQEALLDLSSQALGEIAQGVAGIARMRELGLKLPADDSAFARRETALRSQRVPIERSIGELNARLWQLIGLVPTTPQQRIWPTEPLQVVVEPLDIDGAVALGLASRPELGMLRRVYGRLDADSLPAARSALSQLDPLLGSSPQPLASGILGLAEVARKKRAAERELPERRRQLAQYMRSRNQEVQVEVRQAAETVESRVRQIAVAKEALEQWQRQLRETEARRASMGGTLGEVVLSRLAVIEARGALVERIAAWKIAQARLKQAQGLLVAECGM